MTTQEPTQGPWQEGSGARAVLAMTMVSLALLGGWLLWQLGQGSGETPTLVTSGTHHTTPDAVVPAAGPTGDGNAASGAARPAGAGSETVYLVASEAAAAFTRAVLSGAPVIPDTNAPPSFPASVVVVAAGQNGAAVVTDEQVVRAKAGLPPRTIVDLRPPVGVPPSGADGTFPIELAAPGLVP